MPIKVTYVENSINADKRKAGIMFAARVNDATLGLAHNPEDYGVRFCIRFNDTIRLGHFIGNIVGPFPTIAAAHEWFNANEWAREYEASVDTILDPSC